MLIDIAIIIFAVSALYRGREMGFVRQLCSTAGFFGGMFVGAWLQPHTVGLVHSQSSRTLVTILTTLGCALILLTVGEYIGLVIKHKTRPKAINKYDNAFGSVLGVASLLFSVWLLAAVVSGLPISGGQTAIKNSRIISALNRVLPDAPTLISELGHLINPNGFPQVFVGNEPPPRSNVDLPALGDLRSAVEQDQASVVKIEGQGCGGIVDGSGFVVRSNLIATNAHVVAGIKHPFVLDGNGRHSGTVIWFDPNLDFAVLRVSGLAGKSLPLLAGDVKPGTAAAVLGYPGGGAFTASPAAVLDQFTASGRNIYDRGNTERAVYEVRASIMPGNSGGPLIAKDGSVIGVVFAESTSYKAVGYALTTGQPISAINQAAARNQPASTRSCTE